MSDYEVALLLAVLLLTISLLVGFSAVTNSRPVGTAVVLFIGGGAALYYATTFGSSGNSLAEDIPKAFYSLYAWVMN